MVSCSVSYGGTLTCGDAGCLTWCHLSLSQTRVISSASLKINRSLQVACHRLQRGSVRAEKNADAGDSADAVGSPHMPALGRR